MGGKIYTLLHRTLDIVVSVFQIYCQLAKMPLFFNQLPLLMERTHCLCCLINSIFSTFALISNNLTSTTQNTSSQQPNLDVFPTFKLFPSLFSCNILQIGASNNQLSRYDHCRSLLHWHISTQKSDIPGLSSDHSAENDLEGLTTAACLPHQAGGLSLNSDQNQQRPEVPCMNFIQGVK